MSDQYVGEIRMFSGNYAPQGWAFCNGQTLQISEYEVLYVLIGTTYGGDGRSTFALPDLRGRVPIHNSSQYPLASKGGAEIVTLTQGNLPPHTHHVYANNTPNEATEGSPTNNTWGISDITNYQMNTTSNIVQMNVNLISSIGGNQPHNNMMPSMVINFIIATTGLFPSSN